MSNGPALLQAFLDENRITQTAVAKTFDVSRTALKWWLTGKHPPSLESARAIEKWTSGKVPVSSWGRPPELLDTIEPFAGAA